jgi:dUTP pyrophosphatase
MSVTVKLKHLSTAGRILVSAHPSDAGFDLFAAEETLISPSGWARVGTGIALEIPQGFEGQIRSRSGMAYDNGLIVMNSPGTVDAGYRGEVMVLLLNLGKAPFHVTVGMRIAQLVIAKCARVHFVEDEKLGPSDRNSDGFGSTGRSD